MYNVMSPIAEEFYLGQRNMKTLEYAKEHKSDRELISALIERAEDCKGAFL